MAKRYVFSLTSEQRTFMLVSLDAWHADHDQQMNPRENRLTAAIERQSVGNFTSQERDHIIRAALAFTKEAK